ncbi:MAG: hypothetical protein K2P81_07155 [Bacteriovoracaceae bacterium]|nr:hypothetical protein [Bacteriovoracaceae bacterium]
MIGFKEIKKEYFANDLMSGFVLFLIALPLCVGIALGSGAPASAGIIAGCVGGILGSLVGGVRLSINGPAAGMIVVVLGGINSLSDGDALLGFKRFLSCVVIVGILQFLSGLARLGRLALLAPLPVIHGMMAAIGSIIIIKQIPVLLGVKPEAKSLIGIVGEIPRLIQNMTTPIAVIALVSFLVLVAWQFVPSKVTRFLPGPLMAVVVGLIASFQFGMIDVHMMDMFGKTFEIGPKFLVPLKVSADTFFTFPLFDKILETRSLIVIISVFLIGSLESQLSTLAVDKMDPEKRVSDYNQEFIGKGLVNLLCGLIGGLPVITEIVRSSANVANGAKSPLSNFLHGLFMAVAVMLIPTLLAQIPLAALAAILLLIGWRLSHPKHFIHAWHQGLDGFIAFVVTWSLTILDDLLVGIGVGFLVYVLAQLIKGVNPKFFLKPEIHSKTQGSKLHVEVSGALVFSGFLSLSSACLVETEASEVLLDLARVSTMDDSAKENVLGLENEIRSLGKKLTIIWPATHHSGAVHA